MSKQPTKKESPKKGATVTKVSADQEGAPLNDTGRNLLNKEYDSNVPLNKSELPEIHKDKTSAAKGWKQIDEQTDNSGSADPKHDNERA